MSICKFAVGQEQSQRQINLWEQLNGRDSFKDDWGATFLHVVLISAKRLKEIALAPDFACGNASPLRRHPDYLHLAKADRYLNLSLLD